MRDPSISTFAGALSSLPTALVAVDSQAATNTGIVATAGANATANEVAAIVASLCTVRKRTFQRQKRALSPPATPKRSPLINPLMTPQRNPPQMPVTPQRTTDITRSVESTTTRTVTSSRSSMSVLSPIPSTGRSFASPSSRCSSNQPLPRDWVPWTPTLASPETKKKRFVPVRRNAKARAGTYGTVLRSRKEHEVVDLFQGEKSVVASVARRVVEHGVTTPDDPSVSPLDFLLKLPGWELVCERLDCPIDAREAIFDQLECAPSDIIELLERNYVSVGCRKIPDSIKPPLILEESIRAEAQKRVDDLEAVERRKERLREHQTEYDATQAPRNKENLPEKKRRGRPPKWSSAVMSEGKTGTSLGSTAAHVGTATAEKRVREPIASTMPKKKQKWTQQKVESRDLLTDIQDISDHLLTDREFAVLSLRSCLQRRFLDSALTEADATSHVVEWLDLVATTNDSDSIAIVKKTLEMKRVPKVRGLVVSIVLAFRKNRDALEYFCRELAEWPCPTSKGAIATIATALLENYLPLPKCLGEKLSADAYRGANLSPAERMWLACWQAETCRKSSVREDLSILTTLLDTHVEAESREPFLPNALTARLSEIETVSEALATSIVEVARKRKIKQDIRCMLALAARSKPVLLLDACLAASSLEFIDVLPTDFAMCKAIPRRDVTRADLESFLIIFEKVTQVKTQFHWDFLHTVVCANTFPAAEEINGKVTLNTSWKSERTPMWQQLLQRCPSSHLFLNVTCALDQLEDKELEAPDEFLRDMLSGMVQLLQETDEHMGENFESFVWKTGMVESDVKTKAHNMEHCQMKVLRTLKRGCKLSEPMALLDGVNASYHQFYKCLLKSLRPKKDKQLRASRRK